MAYQYTTNGRVSDFAKGSVTTPPSNWWNVDDCILSNKWPKVSARNEGERMRVALIQTAAGLKPPSGGYRGNYAHLLALVRRGHDVLQTCWAYREDIEEAIADLKTVGRFYEHKFESGTVLMNDKDLNEVRVPFCKFVNVDGITCAALDADLMIATYANNVQQADAAKWIKTKEIPESAKAYSRWLQSNLIEFEPTHTLFNDAFANMISNELVKSMPKVARVEIIHTLEQLPTGPFAGGISGGAMCPEEIELFKSIDAVVSVSKSVQDYALTHCQLETTLLYNHALSYVDKVTSELPRMRDNWALQTVVMVNPAYVKGYNIFLAMARENQARRLHNLEHNRPEKPIYRFVAYSAWGSNDQMLDELREAGVNVHDAVTDMEPEFDQMSVLVMPSLWQEAWGIIATEAQLRGIPVISSDVGGLPEAKRFVEPMVHVIPIDGQIRDENGDYVIPTQNVYPWMCELDDLLLNPARYRATSEVAYYVTRAWIRDFDFCGMENMLLSIRK